MTSHDIAALRALATLAIEQSDAQARTAADGIPAALSNAVNALPALLDRLERAEAAVRAFVAWLDHEEGRPNFEGLSRETHPDGERIWRAWYDRGLELCAEALSKGRALITDLDAARAE